MFASRGKSAAYSGLHVGNDPFSSVIQSSSTDSLGPAMEGPPSPEDIRAYTETMRRGSTFGTTSRVYSPALSHRSQESFNVSLEYPTLSRNSSRSRSGSMSPSRDGAAETVHLFGRQIFSRRGRKAKVERNGHLTSPLAIEEDIRGEESARAHYYGTSSASRRGNTRNSPSPSIESRPMISEPFNFQHVTHTQQTHLPSLQRSSHTDLVTEFSAVRATQAPSNGELKGIQVHDIPIKSYSSDALSAPRFEDFSRPRSSSNHRPLRAPPRPPIIYAKSSDNLKRSIPPVRPPRSPISPTCPVQLPARTSSRTFSVLFDNADPLAMTTTERPQLSAGFRKPAPLKFSALPPTPPLPPPKDNAYNGYFSTDRSLNEAVSPDSEWPLSSASTVTIETEPTELPGSAVADAAIELPVVENPTELQGSEVARTKRQSKSSIRASQSVPALRIGSYTQPEATLGSGLADPKIQPLSPGFKMTQALWDNAIDYAYEHEAEADCEYQWDRCSLDVDRSVIPELPPAQKQLDLHLNKDRQSIYQGRFRPSLLVPLPLEVPELSPVSNSSTTSSDSPSKFLRPSQARPSSQPSLKEVYSFNISPSLLIPNDFKSQMDQDAQYDADFTSDVPSALDFAQDLYHQCLISTIENNSSTASDRSSGFSHGSVRSSSGTRTSSSDFASSKDSMCMKLTTSALQVASPNESLTLSPASDVSFDLPVMGSPATPVHNRQTSAPAMGQAQKDFKPRARASTLTGMAKKQRGSYGLFPQC